MANIYNYIRQHNEISEVLDQIKLLIDKDVVSNAKQLAELINNLAGKLKIHLTMEDKYLYPSLKNEIVSKQIALKFEEEMGNISVIFNEFKLKYNTTNKIETNSKNFKVDIVKLLFLLENRLNKEEKELYILA